MSTAQINSRIGLALALSMLIHGLVVAGLFPTTESQSPLLRISVSLVNVAKIQGKRVVIPHLMRNPGLSIQDGFRVEHGMTNAAPSDAPVIASESEAIQVLHESSGETTGPSNSVQLSSSRAPSPNQIVKPTYTPRALRAGIEGEVVLDVLVGPEGRVSSARIKKSLGYGLDEQALEAIRRSTFAPARKSTGEAIDEHVIYHFRFEITPGVAWSIAH